MKIKYITEDDLNAIKNNLPIILKKVVNEKSESLGTLFGKKELLKNTPYDISEFKMDMSQPKGKESLTDAENVQRVYNHMKFLSDSLASDERIWATYAFGDFFEYMNYRWKANSVEDLKNRYIFGYSIQRSLFRNGISRLWWIGRVTYDDSRTDPYELTRFLCRDQDYIESICGRNVFNNPSIGLTTVEALYDAEKTGIKVDRECVRRIAKYVNLLAGTYLIDSFTKEELYKKIKRKIEA